MNLNEPAPELGTGETSFVPGLDKDGTAGLGNRYLATINDAGNFLLGLQSETGYWVFDLEADVTIPAEYILLREFLGLEDAGLNQAIKRYMLDRQLGDGSWPLYDNGPGNLSATVKAYFSLKLTGQDIESDEMTGARQWILSHGGAEQSNVFTRITLAIFGQIPWRTVPAMPAEIIFLPRWWFFSLDKVSYWSRCVIVPLLIILAFRPVHRPGTGFDISELFRTEPDRLKHIEKLSLSHKLKCIFYLLDRFLKHVQPYVPGWVRKKSLDACEAWTRDHMRSEGGNGAIFPAMANAVMALRLLGCTDDDADYRRGIKALDDLVIENRDIAYVQPCVSPVWDTCLALSALAEAGIDSDNPAIRTATNWLFEKQVFFKGDWARRAPGLDCGGWAFQFENDFYPDLDDTSMVVMCLLRHDAHKDPDQLKRINQAANWVLGMQNSDGGWGAFDLDNHYQYLNNIPFADHDALVDPSTADLTARCIEMLAMLGYPRDFAPIQSGLEFLKRDQKPFGGWYGRWGVNYIYGTWSVLAALGVLSEDPSQAYIRKAVDWLKDIQNQDGGWGEDCSSYDDPGLCGKGDSTPSQTAWALLGLIAAGEADSDNVRRGVDYLLDGFDSGQGWSEERYTGTGFPKVFYLRYYGYRQYFPLWALSIYYRARCGVDSRQQSMMKGKPVTGGIHECLN